MINYTHHIHPTSYNYIPDLSVFSVVKSTLPSRRASVQWSKLSNLIAIRRRRTSAGDPNANGYFHGNCGIALKHGIAEQQKTTKLFYWLTMTFRKKKKKKKQKKTNGVLGCFGVI